MRNAFWLFVLGFLWGCSSPEFSTVLRTSVVTVHVVSSRAQIPTQSPLALGMCKGSHIWVIGKTLSNGKIYMNETILGHEILHVLFQEYPDMLHYPDTPFPVTIWGH